MLNTPSRAFLRALDAQRAWSPLLLRAVLAATFISRGYPQVFERGISASVERWVSGGVPLAAVVGPAVPLIQFFGGCLLVVGLGTRLWGFLLACVMAVAISAVHWSQGFALHAVATERGIHNAGWEWQAALFAMALTLVFTGGGALSVDHVLRRRSERAADTT